MAICHPFLRWQSGLISVTGPKNRIIKRQGSIKEGSSLVSGNEMKCQRWTQLWKVKYLIPLLKCNFKLINTLIPSRVRLLRGASFQETLVKHFYTLFITCTSFIACGAHQSYLESWTISHFLPLLCTCSPAPEFQQPVNHCRAAECLQLKNISTRVSRVAE